MSSNAAQAVTMEVPMGFSVLQPSIGKPLQFFPAMGSQQLDEMIDAYVPGFASILEKRTAVSLEFFDHCMQTGESFKFFMVFPRGVASSAASPASSSAMYDSGYGSVASTPAVSTARQAPSASQTREKYTARKSRDLDHIPGMQIMTKDGRDVTHSISRGSKTREQREHAHLMRVLKACPSCKAKKMRCDPSHKEQGAASTLSKPRATRITKKRSKTAAPASQPPAAIPPTNSVALESLPESQNFAPIEDDSWDQFIDYDSEMPPAIPYSSDISYQPGYGSPFTPYTNTSFSSLGVPTPERQQQQPQQPIISGVSNYDPGLEQAAGLNILGGTGAHTGQQIAQPFLNGGLGNNYTDFRLYSPVSDSLDLDDPTFFTEVTAGIPSGSANSERSHVLGGHAVAAAGAAHGNISLSAGYSAGAQDSHRGRSPAGAIPLRVAGNEGFSMNGDGQSSMLSKPYGLATQHSRRATTEATMVELSGGTLPPNQQRVTGRVGVLPPNEQRGPGRLGVLPSNEQRVSARASVLPPSEQRDPGRVASDRRNELASIAGNDSSMAIAAREGRLPTGSSATGNGSLSQQGNPIPTPLDKPYPVEKKTKTTRASAVSAISLRQSPVQLSAPALINCLGEDTRLFPMNSSLNPVNAVHSLMPTSGLLRSQFIQTSDKRAAQPSHLEFARELALLGIAVFILALGLTASVSMTGTVALSLLAAHWSKQQEIASDVKQNRCPGRQLPSEAFESVGSTLRGFCRSSSRRFCLPSRILGAAIAA